MARAYCRLVPLHRSLRCCARCVRLSTAPSYRSLDVMLAATLTSSDKKAQTRKHAQPILR